MSRRRRRLRRTLLWLAAGLVLLCVGFLTYQVLTWPDVAALATANPSSTAFIHRAHPRNPPPIEWVPYSQISPHLKRAVLVAEDINFFSHNGFETTELRSAIRDALRTRRPPRGASTITQQLAKNLWLTPSRNPWRKLKEALLTFQLERHLDKRRILELYLNVVELGPAVWGVGAAAREYFATPASELSELQSAELAAGLSRPSRWNPRSTSGTYRHRVELILRRMERATFLWKVI